VVGLAGYCACVCACVCGLPAVSLASSCHTTAVTRVGITKLRQRIVSLWPVVQASHQQVSASCLAATQQCSATSPDAPPPVQSRTVVCCTCCSVQARTCGASSTGHSRCRGGLHRTGSTARWRAGAARTAGRHARGRVSGAPASAPSTSAWAGGAGQQQQRSSRACSPAGAQPGTTRLS
jgi:hypothetical protein